VASAFVYPAFEFYQVGNALRVHIPSRSDDDWTKSVAVHRLSCCAKGTQVTGKSLSSSLALETGLHTLNVYGKVAGVVTDKKTASVVVAP
jgi:hypothetical protein